MVTLRDDHATHPREAQDCNRVTLRDDHATHPREVEDCNMVTLRDDHATRHATHCAKWRTATGSPFGLTMPAVHSRYA